MIVGREIEVELEGSDLFESLWRKTVVESSDNVTRRDVKCLVSIKQSDDLSVPIYH